MNGLRGSGKLLAKIVPRGTNNRDMDYRKEIALLIKRRRQYYPVMKRLHSIHRESPVRKQPREIHAGRECSRRWSSWTSAISIRRPSW